MISQYKAVFDLTTLWAGIYDRKKLSPLDHPSNADAIARFIARVDRGNAFGEIRYPLTIDGQRFYTYDESRLCFQIQSVDYLVKSGLLVLHIKPHGARKDVFQHIEGEYINVSPRGTCNQLDMKHYVIDELVTFDMDDIYGIKP